MFEDGRTRGMPEENYRRSFRALAGRWGAVDGCQPAVPPAASAVMPDGIGRNRTPGRAALAARQARRAGEGVGQRLWKGHTAVMTA